MDNDQRILLSDDNTSSTEGNCPRCDGDHPITFQKFKQNKINHYDYWANCPVLNEPILIKVLPGENITE